MADSRITVRPLSVARRGAEGSVVVFECTMPPELKGDVSVWATRGQRRRLPTGSGVASEWIDFARHAVALVTLPPGYAACTLHVRVGAGLRAHRASYRVSKAEFAELERSVANAEVDERYHEWFLGHRASTAELERQRAHSFGFEPLVSVVVPVFRTPEDYLVDLIECMLAQSYPRFELLMVNVSGSCDEVDRVLARYRDERIRVIEAPNVGISENTNVGIAEARGDYVAFVDHDDFIEPDALYRYVEAINEHPDSDLLFCDEDYWDAGLGCFCGARFKPGWNPDLAYTQNYVCHMLMVSRRVLELTERSGDAVSGAQDFDLTLKASEVARRIVHVPGVYYHWRRHPHSTSLDAGDKPYAVEAGRVALQGHFDRVGPAADVELASHLFTYRPRLRAKASGVSIVLLAHGGAACSFVDSLEAGGCRYEVIAVSRESDLNDAVGSASNPLVAVLDAAVDSAGRALIDALIEPLARDDVGCSSAQIVDRAGTVLSAGLCLRADGRWRHMFAGIPCYDDGYMFMLRYARDVLAAPLRCLAFRRADFQAVGGFDGGLRGDWLAIDLCLKLRAAGLLTVSVPHEPAVLAGDLPDPSDAGASNLLIARHAWLAGGDPYLSEHLDQCCRLLP